MPALALAFFRFPRQQINQRSNYLASLIISKTPTAMHRRPMFFGTLRWKPQQEMSVTFLDLRGRHCGLFIHLGRMDERGKPTKEAGRISLARFWLGVAGQKHLKNMQKTITKNAEKHIKMVSMGSTTPPWRVQGSLGSQSGPLGPIGFPLVLIWVLLEPIWVPLGPIWGLLVPIWAPLAQIWAQI